MWNDAAVQILFTLGGGFGTLITMGSYNKFHNNCSRDPVVITLANCCTSFFLGIVIFSILGFMADRRGVPVHNVVHQGCSTLQFDTNAVLLSWHKLYMYIARHLLHFMSLVYRKKFASCSFCL